MDQHLIDALVAGADLHSDGGHARLLNFAEEFLTAHKDVPRGLSIEVGTRRGGTALLFLSLLQNLYPDATRPFLLTVDPYGNKPYWVTDSTGVPAYGAEDYCAAKALLARFPNHAHFLMESSDFFGRLYGANCWRPGPMAVELLDIARGVNTRVPVGEKTQMGGVGFCLLDGCHSAATILRELEVLFGGGWMAQGGRVVVDNVDVDARTKPMLCRSYQVEFFHGGECATIKGTV